MLVVWRLVCVCWVCLGLFCGYGILYGLCVGVRNGRLGLVVMMYFVGVV